LSDVVFYTSPQSFSAKYKKSRIMPVGIDTERFRIQDTRYLPAGRQGKIPNTILYLGRFSPVKNVDVLIEAANLLDKQGIDFILNIVGRPGEGEEQHFKKVKDIAKGLEDRGKIRFLGKVANYQAPEIYSQNDIFVNLTQVGSFDKTTLEAMACQNMVLVSNPVFEGIFPKELREILMFEERDAEDLAKKLAYLMNLPEVEKEKIGRELREMVIKSHSLDGLVREIISIVDV
ncbi:MAG: glycosyltransferase family 4 protein, partial [bacterium]|nr:glycosyltransferase family 4 protein [bacterium]